MEARAQARMGVHSKVWRTGSVLAGKVDWGWGQIWQWGLSGGAAEVVDFRVV